jgi:hypothetical protein
MIWPPIQIFRHYEAVMVMSTSSLLADGEAADEDGVFVDDESGDKYQITQHFSKYI